MSESDSGRLPNLSHRTGTDEHDVDLDAHDVWDRIRIGMRLEGTERGDVDREIVILTEGEFFERAAHRSQPYLHYIVTELERRQMPLELALLPIVESGYKADAYSRHGAAGLWQFIQGTADRFGLKRSRWYDGRRDVIAATDAALTYLQRLHEEFNGDWLNAIAAYNCGEKTVELAINRNRAIGKPTDFWSLKLPQETRGYVPRLLAAGVIIRSPLRYGKQLPPVDNKPYMVAVDVGHQIDLERAAQLADIDSGEIHVLNPGFLHRVTDPNGPHRIVVPASRAEQFRQVLAQSSDSLAVKPTVHSVSNGETLGGIAHRYGVAIEAIRTANHLDNRHRLRPGETLLVPIDGSEVADTSEAQGAGARAVAYLGEDPQEGRVPERHGERLIHVVRAGDSLWSISRAYRVSVDKLMAWNGLHRGVVLALQQRLVIWKASEADVAATNAVATPVVAYANPARQLVEYHVHDGDSLWTIAQRFRVSVDDLRSWNRMSGREILQPGDQLSVYLTLADTGQDDDLHI